MPDITTSSMKVVFAHRRSGEILSVIDITGSVVAIPRKGEIVSIRSLATSVTSIYRVVSITHSLPTSNEEPYAILVSLEEVAN